MIAYSLFINLYFGVLGYVYSKDRREWWDLSQEEKDELLRKHLPEGEYTDSCEGDFPEGWFDLEDWEKKAILDKNLEDYYNEQSQQTSDFSRDSLDISKYGRKSSETKIRRCIIV